MNSFPTLDIVVVSWQGHAERSRHIARQIAGLPGVRLRVIYSNAEGERENGPGTWQQVPDDHFFGRKFAAALRDFDGDVLLLVQADALCTDWPAIVARCRQRFAERPRLGMWAPRVDFSPWVPKRVDILGLPGTALTAVAQTDAIVLGLSRSTVQRLTRLDYTCNNIGWGIDWVAICHCYTRGLEVLREDGLQIVHPPSRGYGWREAVVQWRTFMQQLDECEQAMFAILLRYTAERRRGLLGKLQLAWRRRRCSRAADRVLYELRDAGSAAPQRSRRLGAGDGAHGLR
ncbi:MAG TPA: hypothetical protein VES00_02125 [Burkholderiaceae bacterium]|nr:hypothetical protein [Burkholderiaceae bacterium]